MAHILVVDDEKSICELLEITFRKDGHRVEVANSVEAAKRKLEGSLFDIVISDVRMPGATGVVQEAGVPARPSISTRQSRQEPKASTISVAHSFGICVPTSIAARMMEVPSGTVMLLPSMVSVTVFSALARGVP